MAVYKRTYKIYDGPRAVAWPRFLILTRYSYARLFQSKFLVLFTAACLFYPLGSAVFIYVSHNLELIETLNLVSARLPKIDGAFFYSFCVTQGTLAYLLTALVGPGLVAPDLANGALPLYFSRPFSRLEYVAGKMSLLLGLLSLITWVPALILFAIEWSLAGWGWAWSNLWLAWAIFAGLGVWITVVSLIALAMSAWVKWRVAAGALVLGVYFAGAGFGAAINGVMRSNNGSLIDLTRVMQTIWADMFRYDSGATISVSAAWTALAVASSACVWLLARKVRPFEVVK